MTMSLAINPVKKPRIGLYSVDLEACWGPFPAFGNRKNDLIGEATVIYKYFPRCSKGTGVIYKIMQRRFAPGKRVLYHGWSVPHMTITHANTAAVEQPLPPVF